MERSLGICKQILKIFLYYSRISFNVSVDFINVKSIKLFSSKEKTNI